MKKSPLKRIGKIGRVNLEANKRLKELFEHHTNACDDNHNHSCEMKLDGCLGRLFLSFAHRHKRIFYKGDVEKLSAINQVVIACQNCHQLTENNQELNDEVFERLRGKEK